jgi:hypothetical protein
MSSVVISGNTSGTITLDAPAVAGTTTLTLPTTNGTIITTGSTFGGTGPAFNAYISSNQSLTSGVTTKIALNAEFFDTANCFDSTTNYRFTPNVAGYYQLNLPLLAYSSASNITSVAVFLYKNGSSITYQQTLLPATILASACLSTVVFANGTTDYFEMYANVAGTGIFVSGGTGGSVTTTFSGAFVRSA